MPNPGAQSTTAGRRWPGAARPPAAFVRVEVAAERGSIPGIKPYFAGYVRRQHKPLQLATAVGAHDLQLHALGFPQLPPNGITTVSRNRRKSEPLGHAVYQIQSRVAIVNAVPSRRQAKRQLIHRDAASAHIVALQTNNPWVDLLLGAVMPLHPEPHLRHPREVGHSIHRQAQVAIEPAGALRIRKLARVNIRK